MRRLILAQGRKVDRAQVDLREGEEFVHPEDGETFDEFTSCVDCHSGSVDLYE